MADESEKRFHAVMDKLFHAPTPPNSKSKSSKTTGSTGSSGGGLSGGKKRPHSMMSTLALVDPKSKRGVAESSRNVSGGTVLQAPMCRPWDRGDLLKRLATFKSMTWFAKPEVVNAINCARIGWINVDMDIIACESCGARLLFSTPSSWAQQQVEKAALVFSLKLNSGHKLLCPWVDNACDEKLAQFPPMSLVDLVDNYKKRYISLSQLLALPVISSLAIDYMRSLQLEYFLKSPSTLEHVDKSDNISATEYHGDESEEVFSILYYQALKLISLCGWEPRSLPYIVDCKDLEDQSARDGALTNPSIPVPNARTPGISVYSSGTAENVKENEDSSASSEQYDPASAVLDCKLCGATVGLWTFCTTPRPIEFIRFIGDSELSNESRAARQMENTDHTSVGASEIHVESGELTTSTAKTVATSSNGVLNLTIAGGPPPAEQNFRPKISLPVVGQNLRSRFSSAFESRCDDHRRFKDVSEGSREHSPNQQEDMRLIKGKTHEDANCSSTSNQSVQAVGDDSAGTCTKGDKQVNIEGCGVQTTMHTMNSSPYIGKDKQPLTGKAMQFDPIRQHRHFCPWIASSGKSVPGWKQTLSALERQKEFFCPSPTNQPSSSVIEVDDPIGSVKKLLTPPSAKRKKLTHGSS